MINRLSSILCILAISVLMPMPMYAYEFLIGESAYLEFKGDLTYSVKYRMEDPDPLLVGDTKGNSNFENGDIVNNKGIVRMEVMFDAPYTTFFTKLEAFQDSVYTDDELYPEGTDLELAKRYAASRAEALEYYLDLHSDSITLRIGKQIVEWGELSAPVFAPGVNVMNMYDGSKVGAAGYTIRDYKVPAQMAWLSMEISSNLSLEAAYSQDFEPRSSMAVVGTFGSFMDNFGFGGPGMDGMEVKIPTEPEEMQQYGAAARMVFPSLGNLELGVFTANYLNWMPMVDAFEGVITYERMDMYGFTLSQVVGDWQMFGEFTYRPNQAAQMRLEGTVLPIAGFEKVQTFNWGFGGLAMFSDFLSFTPWTVQLAPMFEFFGGNNLDYDETKNFAIPEQTTYYMASLTFNSSDMVDNTALSFGVSISGPLHEEESGFYSIANTLTARVGDNMGLMFGYDIKGGDPEKAGPYGSPGYAPDRDALTLGFTWYFM
ncbi:MAG: DUF1302 domain-containing protein [Proteobacteria bacterium]|nr:DUF1302 domain-containing protein [Pseudomonadota bacterium]